MNRKVLLTLFILLFIPGFSFAQELALQTDLVKVTDATAGSSATAALSLTNGSVVVGVILDASVATSFVEIYDSALTTYAAVKAAVSPKLVLKVATDEDSIVYTGVNEYFTNGIFVYVVDGQVFIKRRGLQ